MEAMELWAALQKAADAGDVKAAAFLLMFRPWASRTAAGQAPDPTVASDRGRHPWRVHERAIAPPD